MQQQLLIKTLAGLEEVLAAECIALGHVDVEVGRRAVSSRTDLAGVYRANLELRTAIRILLPLAEAEVHNEQQLYDFVYAQEWSRYLGKNRTLVVDAITFHPKLDHSHFLALKTKDAIVDQLRDKTGDRPDVDTETPDVRINLHLDALGKATLSLDSSGEGLHRRGYRRVTGEAPLNEVLAAGLVALSGYEGEVPFVDPLCGSGTIPIEAALVATRTAPGLGRRFGFERWLDFDADLFAGVRREAQAKIRSAPHPIIGVDRSDRVLEAAQRNIAAAGLLRSVDLQRSTFQRFQPPAGPGTLIANPPYDLRLKTADIGALYQELGDTFKKSYRGYTAWIFSANLEALKRIGLKTSRRIHLFNGPVEARLYRYDLYAGSKKAKANDE